MYPKALKKVMEDFQKLPGIGEKTAERLALFVASKLEDDEVTSFGTHLIDMKTHLKTCKKCHALTEEDLCSVCQDSSRTQDTIMVLGDAKDVFMMEKMQTYHGLYHVLGGVIDFSRGITDQELNIDTLSQRMTSVKELIIATNSTVEGEMTAKFIKSLFEKEDLKITRLAYGLPVGTDLKYADELTLIKAVENRQVYK